MTLRLRSGICDLLKQYHDIKIASGTKAVSIDRYINYIDDFYFNNNFKEMVYTKEMILKVIMSDIPEITT